MSGLAGCFRCWRDGNRVTPAVWVDPEKEKLCDGCRIALGWGVEDCTALGAVAPKAIAHADEGWLAQNRAKKKRLGLDGSPQPGKKKSGGESGNGAEQPSIPFAGQPSEPAAFDSRSPLQKSHGEKPKEKHMARECIEPGCTMTLVRTNKSGYCREY